MKRILNVSQKTSNKTARVGYLIWIICLLGTGLTVFYTTVIKGQLFDKAPIILALLLVLFVLLGFSSFLVASISLIYRNLSRVKNMKRPLLPLATLGLFAIFPLYALVLILKPLIKKIRIQKLKFRISSKNLKPILFGSITTLTVIVIILPVWVGSYVIMGKLILDKLNLVKDPMPIAGTGSMFPTFPKGQGKTIKEQTKEIVDTPGMQRYPSGFNLFGQDFFTHKIGRGDIITFYNSKTAEITKKDGGKATGFLKRVIGLPGDKIEIKDGLLILNGQPQKEPYTAKARSTFGGEFLPDCKTLTVPQEKLFVMGDNRKGSGDSRQDLGFVDTKDIDHVIPFNNQKGVLDKNWRNTDKDFDEISKIKLDKNKYLELLNKKRVESGAKPLTYQSKLEASANARGKAILKYDDFSFEATRSGYTMEQSMADAGYSNITYGEAPTSGYYEAEELIENQFEFPETKKFLLYKDYQEIGIAEVEGELNGCPAQVIVQHFAGYIPPNYKQADIDSWKDVLSNLREIQPGWAKLKDYPNFYNNNKKDIDRINEIISTRTNIAQTVISRMEANQWLTQSEKQLIQQDIELSKEANSLSTKLNSL
ncbi:MAG: signal peptidase I [Patescibacteria group bacterium]